MAASLTQPTSAFTNSTSSGTTTLVSGTVSVASAPITANSRILVTQKTPGGTTGVDYSVPASSRVAGTPGTFVINAVDSAGALVNTDTSTLDWVVMN